MIIRKLEEVINRRLFMRKVIVLTGPRQTGKTTLIHNVIRNIPHVLTLSGDDPDTRILLSLAHPDTIRDVIGMSKIVFVDEAQQVEKIERTARIMVDHFSDIQLIICSSAPLDTKDTRTNSLTGRKWEYRMYPVEWSEFEETYGYFISQQQRERRVIYGMYPDIITHVTEERERLKQLVDSYVYKKPDIWSALLKALALQMGKELSVKDLSKSLRTDIPAINTCIEALENSFIIFCTEESTKLGRHKWSSYKKVFFWDNGIRNAILNNFNPLSKRKDAGLLWDNFLASDMMKKHNWIGAQMIYQY